MIRKTREARVYDESGSPKEGKKVQNSPNALIRNLCGVDMSEGDDSTHGCLIPFENKAFIKYCAARADLKGEDRYDVKPLMMKYMENGEGESVSRLFSYFAVLDGHNGQGCAEFSVHNLLPNIFEFVDDNLDWGEQLPQAMVNGFEKTHRDFAANGKLSGTTCTSVIIDGQNAYIGNVGDSKAIFDDGKGVYDLTIDHRLESNPAERKRIIEKGGIVDRSKVGGTKHGPLRVDGTLCVSRSLGDIDVSKLVTATPDVTCIKLPPTGGRIIIASDGVWDVLTSQNVANFARKYPNDLDLACDRILRKTFKMKGFRDDTTCIIIDILPNNKVNFQSCMKIPIAERQKPILTVIRDLQPTEMFDKKYRKEAEDTRTNDVRVKGQLRLREFQESDGFHGRPKQGHTHLHSWNRGISRHQYELELNRLNGPYRHGNYVEDDKIISIADKLGYDALKPELVLLKKYPQRIQIQRLLCHVRQ